MKDSVFFGGFFLAFLIMAIIVAQKEHAGGVIGNMGTTTPRTQNVSGSTNTTGSTREATYRAPTPTPKTERQMTPAEIERKVADIYKQLDKLEDAARKALLREPASPYSSAVTLRRGNVYTEDPDQEYLMLTANSKNTREIPISNWYLESYVTGERAFIPDGTRVLEKWRTPVESDIYLAPGEMAYLVTGDSPIDASFRENMCTGYLAAEGTFIPSLRRVCPRPLDELDRFGTKIDLDDDDCYAFMRRLGTCVTPEEETYTRTKVGGACSVFVDTTFNYNDCVRLHRYDPYFTRDGYWHIYLSERNALWRKEREIIRLMDEEDRVIAVMEY